MEYEQVTILLLVSSHVLITPFVLSRSLRIALPALALLLCFGGWLMTTRGVVLLMYTHYVPAISALYVSQSILNGDGRVVVTEHVFGPLLIFLNEGFLSQYLALQVYTHRFYSLSHNLLHFITAGWMASFLADHAYRRWWPERLGALRAARQLHDPMVMVAEGLGMWAHQHDVTPIGEWMHDFWGISFLCMAAAHLLSSAVHAACPRDAPLALIVRALHSFCWTANGLWAALLGFWISVWGDDMPKYQGQTDGHHRWTGAREVFWPAVGQQLPSGYEEGMYLLAFTLWLAGAIVAHRVYKIERGGEEAAQRPARCAPMEEKEEDGLLG